nr:hypothetical protein [Bacillus pacificus]
MASDFNEYGIEPYIIDPVADKEEAKHEYGLEFDDLSKMVNLDAIIIAVSHEQFKDITKQQFDRLYAHNSRKIIFDIKGSLDKSEFEKDYIYWRL